MANFSTYNKVRVDDGTNVFYREAGSSDAPVMLLLHGYPTSSYMFRDLIPILAPYFRVLAPDLPGFGFTEPSSLYKYTFAAIADTIDLFLTKLKVDKFYVYVFDYGAPTGFRLALKHPERVSGIVSQNGNAYVEGVQSDFWQPIREYWKKPKSDPTYFDALSNYVQDPNNVTSQYTDGEANLDALDPLAWTLDQALLTRPGQTKIQVELFHDYQLNVELYPKFQEYLRTSNVPVLVAWGKNDTIFPPVSAEAYKRDVKNLAFHYVDGGHFALESHVEDIAGKIIEVFGKKTL